MSEMFHKLVVSPDQYQEIIITLREISNIVHQLNHNTIDSNYWTISDGGNEFISNRKNDAVEDILLPIENATWNDVKKMYPMLDAFFEKYNLVKFIGKIHTEVWPIHRHVFSDDDIWSLTIFDKNVKDTILNFYNVDDDRNKTLYDTLPNECDVEPCVSISISEGDMYCINTWEWHSYFADNNVDVFLLYPKGVKSFSDMITFSERNFNE